MLRSDTKIFVKQFLVYFFPLLIFFALPVFILAFAGEMVPIKDIIQAQRDQKNLVLFGMGYVDPVKYYKMQSVLIRNPTVIALGNSRVMQFRSKFFRKDAKFFNAGGAVETVKQFKYFLNMIPTGKEPKVIILGLDQRLFNPRYEADFAGFDIDSQLSNPPNYLETVRLGYLLYKDYFKKKFMLKVLFNPERINKFGFNAIVKHSGFRNDGSYYYGDIVENPDDPETRNRFDDIFRRISHGTDLFEYGSEYSTESVSDLREFLKECALRNIYVVGFLPPFPHVVYEKLRTMGNKYAYMFQLNSVLPAVFKGFNFNFFDFSNIASVGSSDMETIDGVHGSEKAYLRLFLLILEGDPRIREVAADEKFLKKRLGMAVGPYVVFGNDEY